MRQKQPSEATSSEAPRPPRPRRLFSKLVRSAALAAGEEIIASRIASRTTPSADKHGGVTSRVPKMALYGALVNTTLTPLLFRAVEALRGRRNKPAQLLALLFIAAPVQKLAHFASIAYAHGARTFSCLRDTVRAVFLPSVALLAIFASAALAFAHLFLPRRLWPRFFQHVRLLVGVYDNVIIKKEVRKMERREQRREQRRERDGHRRRSAAEEERQEGRGGVEDRVNGGDGRPGSEPARGPARV